MQKVFESGNVFYWELAPINGQYFNYKVFDEVCENIRKRSRHSPLYSKYLTMTQVAEQQKLEIEDASIQSSQDIHGIEGEQNSEDIISEEKVPTYAFNIPQIDTEDYSIEDLKLSIRVTNGLSRIGCKKVKDLLDISVDKLASARNMGVKSFEEVLFKMKELGYTYDETEQHWVKASEKDGKECRSKKVQTFYGEYEI